jgi:hypothetical protein
MPGRRFFTSGDTLGTMGLGPARAELRDHICLLMGCDVPILLRSEGDHFVLVGETYVHVRIAIAPLHPSHEAAFLTSLIAPS